MTLSKRAVEWNLRGQSPPSLLPVVVVSIVVVVVVVDHPCHRCVEGEPVQWRMARQTAAKRISLSGPKRSNLTVLPYLFTGSKYTRWS